MPPHPENIGTSPFHLGRFTHFRLVHARYWFLGKLLIYTWRCFSIWCLFFHSANLKRCVNWSNCTSDEVLYVGRIPRLFNGWKGMFELSSRGSTPLIRLSKTPPSSGLLQSFGFQSFTSLVFYNSYILKFKSCNVSHFFAVRVFQINHA